VKRRSVANRGDGCGGDQRPDSGDFAQAPAGLVVVANPLDLLGGHRDVALQLLPLDPEPRQQDAHARGQSVVGILQQARHLVAQLRRSATEGDASFQQKAANLVDDCRAPCDEPVAHPVQRLQVQLLVGLDGHEAHVLPRYRLGDGFGIEKVILVRLEKGLHELRRNQPRIMSLPSQRRPKEMRSGTGFHADQGGLEVGGVGQQLRAGELFADHHLATLIKRHQMKGRFPQINADGSDMHKMILRCKLLLNHPTAG
jgi:hypothetical protein